MPNAHSAASRLVKAPSRGIPTLARPALSVNPVEATNSAAVACEALESRQFLSASLNGAGWTVVTPTAGSRIIYVSNSSGNDRNSGLSPSAPLQTIAKGESLVRNNSADELLLKRGDTWSAPLGSWSKSGISQQEPLLIGTYGSGARPVLNTGDQPAFTDGGGTLYNVDIIGLKMVASARGAAGANGFSINSRVNNFLIENCDIEGYGNDIVFQQYYGPMTNVTIRRSIVADAWSGNGGHSQGLYCDGVNGITLQDNVFDHNGWNKARGGWMTVYNHDVYITSHNSGLIATNNIFSNASNFGLMDRCGGIVENNVFYNNADGLDFGLVDGSPVTAGGVSGIISGNVFSGSHMIGRNTYGAGLVIGNVNKGGLLVTHNVFTTNSVGKVPAMILEVGRGNSNAYAAVGLNNVTITGNVVYSWYAGIYISGGLHPGGGQYAVNNLHVSGNTFALVKNPNIGSAYAGVNQAGRAAATGFPAPTRTVDAYGASIGDSTAAGFIAAARQMSDLNWASQLTASAAASYVQNGFW